MHKKCDKISLDISHKDKKKFEVRDDPTSTIYESVRTDMSIDLWISIDGLSQ